MGVTYSTARRAVSSEGHTCVVVSDRMSGGTTVALSGQVDWATAPELRRIMRDIEEESPLLIDLSTAHLDAAGTGLLLGIVVRMSRQGRPVVVVAGDALQAAVLTRTGLADLAPVCTSMALAQAHLGVSTPAA